MVGALIVAVGAYMISYFLSFLTLLLRILVVGALIVAVGAYMISYFKKQNDG